MAQVIGRYQCDRGNTPGGDFGHFIPVSLLREVNKYSTSVAGDLRSSIDNQRWPISVAIKRASEILSLLNAVDFERPAPWRDRIKPESSSILNLAKEKIVHKLSSAEFEELVKDVLEVERFENIQLTAGAGENGADVVMSVNAPFFDDLHIVVQIKRITIRHRLTN